MHAYVWVSKTWRVSGSQWTKIHSVSNEDFLSYGIIQNCIWLACVRVSEYMWRCFLCGGVGGIKKNEPVECYVSSPANLTFKWICLHNDSAALAFLSLFPPLFSLSITASIYPSSSSNTSPVYVLSPPTVPLLSMWVLLHIWAIWNHCILCRQGRVKKRVYKRKGRGKRQIKNTWRKKNIGHWYEAVS